MTRTIGREDWPLDADLDKAIAASPTGVHQIVGLSIPGHLSVEDCTDHLRKQMTSILLRCFDGRSYSLSSVISVTDPDPNRFGTTIFPEGTQQILITVVIALADTRQAKIGDLCTTDIYYLTEPGHGNNGSKAESIKWQFVMMKNGYLRVR